MLPAARCRELRNQSLDTISIVAPDEPYAVHVLCMCCACVVHDIVLCCAVLCYAVHAHVLCCACAMHVLCMCCACAMISCVCAVLCCDVHVLCCASCACPVHVRVLCTCCMCSLCMCMCYACAACHHPGNRGTKKRQCLHQRELLANDT